jgi:hypothetical protein
MAKSKVQREESELAPREQAKAAKRDRKMSGASRAGMNSGPAKHFKAIADTVARRGRAASALLAERHKGE